MIHKPFTRIAQALLAMTVLFFLTVSFAIHIIASASQQVEITADVPSNEMRGQGGRVVGGTESLDLQEFSSQRRMYEFAQIHFVLKAQNTGETRLVPGGTVTIKNMLEREVVILPVNESEVAVNPGANFEDYPSWIRSTIFGFGRYRAYLVLNYGATGKICHSVDFWVLPIKTMSSVTGMLFVMIIVFRYGIRRWQRRLTG